MGKLFKNREEKSERYIDNVLCLEPPGTEDDVFREGAAAMMDALAKSRSKCLNKKYVAEITYHGMRHEVWLSKAQIRYRKPEQLAGYIKIKCMQGIE